MTACRLARTGCGRCLVENSASRFCAAIRNVSGLLRARRGVANWPKTVAGQMERHYSPGRTWEITAIGVLGLLHLGDVLDAGRATEPSPRSWLRAAAA